MHAQLNIPANSPSCDCDMPLAPTSLEVKFLIDVIRPGATVKLHDKINARVTQVNIAEGGAIQYQLSWLDHNGRQLQWVWPHEIEVVNSSPSLAIGFRP